MASADAVSETARANEHSVSCITRRPFNERRKILSSTYDSQCLQEDLLRQWTCACKTVPTKRLPACELSRRCMRNALESFQSPPTGQHSVRFPTLFHVNVLGARPHVCQRSSSRVHLQAFTWLDGMEDGLQIFQVPRQVLPRRTLVSSHQPKADSKMSDTVGICCKLPHLICHQVACCCFVQATCSFQLHVRLVKTLCRKGSGKLRTLNEQEDKCAGRGAISFFVKAVVVCAKAPAPTLNSYNYMGVLGTLCRLLFAFSNQYPEPVRPILAHSPNRSCSARGWKAARGPGLAAASAGGQFVSRLDVQVGRRSNAVRAAPSQQRIVV